MKKGIPQHIKELINDVQFVCPNLSFDEIHDEFECFINKCKELNKLKDCEEVLKKHGIRVQKEDRK